MSTGIPIQSKGGSEAAWDLASLRASPAALAAAGLLIAAFGALFYRWFLVQHQFSWGNPDWSHAYVVPLISGYFIWKRRDEIAEAPASTFWPGLAPLLLGILCYFFFVLSFQNHMFQGFALILAIFGLTLLLFGPRLLSLVTLPIAYLGFAITISEMVMLQLTAKLQFVATWGSWVLLNIIGLQTDRSGNTLTINRESGEMIPLNVAEACSGMRMLVAFYALGVAVAFLSCRRWWQRIALLLLAGPVAILVNILRVAFLGVASLWNENLAKGDVHTFIGVLWLVPAFALFMGIVWALNRIAVEPKPEAGGAAA